jgi:hypothetical protein
MQRMVPVVEPNHAYDPASPPSVHDAPPVIESSRERLLEVDGLASLERVDRCLRMEVVREADDHRVELEAVRKVLVVSDQGGVRHLPSGLLASLMGGLRDADDTHAADLSEGIRVDQPSDASPPHEPDG